MKLRSLLTAVVVLVTMALATTAAFAARAPAPQKPLDQEMIFPPDDVRGKRVGPHGDVLEGIVRSVIPLIHIRTSFVPEIMKSSDRL